ncbi:MAG TPA: ATP-binding cassette domain-containing protein [Eubacteriales bacterium]|nr:ATP-binding cassette domain-containing protein [Eubacteriales bacterium]
MLRLIDVTKKYAMSNDIVHALRGVSIAFRKSEFVSVLGPSGCGKTTLLNIIGGLDKYSEGNLIIDGKPTKEYKSADWDAYRNNTVGFVFQSYNLIPHLSVFKNVELALSLVGMTKAERRERTKAALERTGLADQANKKPNQLSGGQMQRVAIARALVNDPKIILADEPTGALDSVTSVQVLDLLKEVSRERLVVMVTHNAELAEKYSTRVVKLFDGLIIDDSNPYTAEEQRAADLARQEAAKEAAEEKSFAEEKTKDKKRVKAEKTAEAKEAKAKKRKAAKKERANMPVHMAISLSFSNLTTKKMRTALTIIAGSIGIIGIALVLSLSNGFSLYLDTVQEELLSTFPLTIAGTSTSITSMNDLTNLSNMMSRAPEGATEFPDSKEITTYRPESMGLFDGLIHINNITEEYVEHVKKLDKDLCNSISYVRAINFHMLSTQNSKALDASSPNIMVSTTSLGWQELYDKEFVLKQFDLLGGEYPSSANDAVLIVDSYNRISATILEAMGISAEQDSYQISDFVGKQFAVIDNDDYYVWNEATEKFTEKKYGYQYTAGEVEAIFGKQHNIISISGVLRIKQTTNISLLYSGVLYTPDLTAQVLESGKASEIAQKQEEYGTALDVLTGEPFEIGMGKILESLMSSGSSLILTPQDAYEYNMQKFGASSVPNSILIYPKSFEAKAAIKAHLDLYNAGKEEVDTIVVLDVAETFGATMGTMVNIVSYVLIAFAAISLVVSSIMIGIVTYISVLERTKEIGILRSIGARKSDISWVFIAETILIGLASGILGVAVTYLITVPASVIVGNLTNKMVTGIAQLNPLHAILLIGLSTALTVISGLIPALIASKKDPVVALRSN